MMQIEVPPASIERMRVKNEACGEERTSDEAVYWTKGLSDPQSTATLEAKQEKETEFVFRLNLRWCKKPNDLTVLLYLKHLSLA